MKKCILLFSMLLFCTMGLFAQVYTGKDARQLIPGTEMVVKELNADFPSFIRFSQGQEVAFAEFDTWLTNHFRMNPDMGFQLIRSESDRYGFIHYRYQQTFKGVPLFANILILHVKNGFIQSMNGQVFTSLKSSTTAAISESSALQAALADIHAVTYKWQLPEEEELLKYATNNPSATYYPHGKLVLVPADQDYRGKNYRLVYQFDVYAHQPMSRNYVFVDAQTSKVLYKLDRIRTENNDSKANATGTAYTAYSGTRTFTTDYTGSTYRLRETGRGLGVETYDMNTGTNYGAAVDFTDADNSWNNVNGQQDEVATDAHWATEMAYDYYYTKHGRNSVDNAGLKLMSYVHYDVNYVNAFWDGTRMTYGDGDGTYSPLTTVDICGHEITHGVTENTANLTYSYESGALSEGFSDIFGTCIEFYAKPPLTPNWLLGEDMGTAFRSLSNPNAYGLPDTYQGTNWYTGTGDNGGVHTNCGVLAFWFYLVCQGGSGTNDIGNAYNVTAITMAKGEQIAYRTLTYYLSASSNYADARTYSIQASADLYGGCSQETQSVTNAWYAVGVGAAYSPTPTDADFSACPTTQCTNAPFTVQFNNLSTNGNTYTWYFGDGATSTAVSPSHTYNTNGSYNVKLVALGGTCGADSITKTAYITVGPAYPCVASVPATGTGTALTSCTGTLYDSGICSDYGNTTDGTITISPTGATSVTLTFTSFNYESGYDYLYIYDGPTTASPQVAGSPFSGTTIPGPFTSSGGSITIRQTSDTYVVGSGFVCNWTCASPTVPPIAQFAADVTTTCSGTVSFTDQSTNGPTSWLWNFGDGQTSTSQNPTHTYAANGTYTVTLQATNSYGSDSEVKTNYVTINMPTAPATTGASRCGTGSVTLSATGSGTLLWYNALSGGTLVNTGTSYTTPSLSTTTSYYVQDSIAGATHNVAKPDNSGGGGYTATGDRYLIFDCYTPLTLVSVQIYGNTPAPGSRTIELRNSAGTVLQSANVNVLAGLNTYTLNFSLPVATDLRLAVTSVANIYRNNTGVAYPYTTAGMLSVKNSDAGTAYYYAFYNWVVREAGCNSSRSIVTATINPNPVAPTSATATPASICSGASSLLSVSGGSGTTLRWMTGSCGGTSVGTGNNLSVSPTSTTTYYARWENACGNSVCQSTTVTVNASPVGGTATAVSPSICTGNSTTINLTGQSGSIQWQTNASGTWQNIPGQTGTSYNTPNLSVATSYRAVITSGSCGMDTSTVAAVTVVPGAISGTAAALPATVCSGSGTTLSLSGYTGNIQWQSNAGGTWQNIIGATTAPYTTAGISAPTSFRAVLSAGGCPNDTSNVVSITLSVASTDPVSISGVTGLCAGTATTLTANGGTLGTNAMYEWGTGSVCGSNVLSGQNAQVLNTATLTDTTIFWVRRVGGDCNISTACQFVTVNVAPAPNTTITPWGATDLCVGDYVVLEVPSESGNTYVWQYNGTNIPGATQNIYTAFQSGSYTVMVTGTCGTATSSPMVVNVWPAPSTPYIIQMGDSLISSAPAGNQWYLNGTLIPGATGQVYHPTVDGAYSVVVTDVHGCGTATSADFNFVFTGIEGIAGVSINVWPNPAHSELFIELNGIAADNIAMKLSDMTGRILKQELIAAFNGSIRYTVDISSFSSGMYFLELKNAGGHWVMKVTKN